MVEMSLVILAFLRWTVAAATSHLRPCLPLELSMVLKCCLQKASQENMHAPLAFTQAHSTGLNGTDTLYQHALHLLHLYPCPISVNLGN